MNGKPDQQRAISTSWKAKLPKVNSLWVMVILILLSTVWLTYRIDGQANWVVKQIKNQPVQSVPAAKPPARNR